MESDNVNIYKSFFSNKKYYCSLPLYSRPFWLDAEFGENNWDVSLIIKDDIIIGSMPYQKPCGFFNKSGMPQFAQNIGPWINEDYLQQRSHKIGVVYGILNDLIEQLPKTGYFIQQFSPSIKFHLPFHWKGFEQTTQYTYLLNIMGSIDEVLSKAYPNKRRAWKKSNETLILKVEDDPLLFFKNHEKWLNASGNNIQYSKEYFLRLYSYVTSNNSGEVISAIDKKTSEIVASLFYCWDSNYAYHLITPINPNLRKLNGLTFLIYNAIHRLPEEVSFYDFEGSMAFNIEKSFREYGAEPVAYHRVRKIDNIFLKLIFKFLIWKF